MWYCIISITQHYSNLTETSWLDVSHPHSAITRERSDDLPEEETEDHEDKLDDTTLQLEVEKLDLEVTIFSRTKTDLGEWKYGRIISSALANTPCANLGPHGVFEKLNMTLGIIMILARLMKKEDREMQSELLEDGMITLTDDASPRRLCMLIEWWPILDEKDRKDMWTPINGYEWPVPMPKDASLDLIRIEMLNLGAEYAVREDHREEDLRKDDLRKEEWKLDVPTIGFVYDMRYWSHRRNRRIVGYFSGLGRPLNFKLGNFESHRCWPNRAWTLQEIPPYEDVFIIGGVTGKNCLEKEVQRRFDERPRSLQHLRKFQSTFNIISEMRNRVSANPLDKITGLVYLFRPRYVPLYDAAQLEADAWEVLVDSMEGGARAELFFYYLGPGNGGRC
ncbi:uncharacterized protein ARMOST_22091 [Armillaria ostoyae]|uniref:Uncharacterized protein n=1 Tax=Armillaria ostoyae TaxID=47428 RepID=A0A284SBV8_ARMOS|nr:uncharacterized protein ARMOST_22091 [Armillaria ostoyae]